MFNQSKTCTLFEAIQSLMSNEDSLAFSYGKFYLEGVSKTKYAVLDDVLSFCLAGRCILISIAPEETGQIIRNFEPENVTSDSELDVTGCPLETSYNPNSSFLDTTCSESGVKVTNSLKRVPLSKAEASFVYKVFHDISLLAQKENNHVECPIAILCDSRDWEHTLFLGMHLTKDHFKRFRIKCDKDKLLSADQLPTLQQIKEQHGRLIRGKKMTASGNVTYDFMPSTAQSQEDLNRESSICLTCHWNVEQSPLADPPEDSNCVIHASISLEEERQYLKHLWQELMRLKALIGRWQNGDLWTQKVANGENEATLTAEEKANSLLEEMTTRVLRPDEVRSAKFGKAESTSNDLFEFTQLPARANQDFTDLLWSTLKDCTSMDDLQKSLTLILQSIESSSIRPIIFPHNKTEIGKIVTRIKRKQCKPTEVLNLQLLPLLVEIGFQKLRQDYFDIFLGSHFVTKDSLSPFLVSDCTKAPEESLNSMVKLHCVAELVALCTRISRSHNFISKCARSAIRQITKVDCVTLKQSFGFPVEWSMVKNVFRRQPPIIWNLKLNTELLDYKLYNSFHFTINKPLGSLIKPSVTPDDSTEPKYILIISTAVKENIM